MSDIQPTETPAEIIDPVVLREQLLAERRIQRAEDALDRAASLVPHKVSPFSNALLTDAQRDALKDYLADAQKMRGEDPINAWETFQAVASSYLRHSTQPDAARKEWLAQEANPEARADEVARAQGKAPKNTGTPLNGWAGRVSNTAAAQTESPARKRNAPKPGNDPRGKTTITELGGNAATQALFHQYTNITAHAAASATDIVDTFKAAKIAVTGREAQYTRNAAIGQSRRLAMTGATGSLFADIRNNSKAYFDTLGQARGCVIPPEMRTAFCDAYDAAMKSTEPRVNIETARGL